MCVCDALWIRSWMALTTTTTTTSEDRHVPAHVYVSNTRCSIASAATDKNIETKGISAKFITFLIGYSFSKRPNKIMAERCFSGRCNDHSTSRSYIFEALVFDSFYFIFFFLFRSFLFLSRTNRKYLMD